MAALSDEQLRIEFDKLDTNKDNAITIDELRKYYIPMQEMLGISKQLAESEIEGLIKRLDTDNDRKITFDEFKNFIVKK
ncbi:unnamed protein product [Adineta ricciae]|uniref:EF-hand domain-containing protein n=1 Tax=Adineta ricciae TaxID=249248 RepID=A0A814UQY1_ADIRI|nr:unnamed protein product [Adineta ricciae]CAF1179171.1 unnamed protein product [Adineta ricciae]